LKWKLAGFLGISNFWHRTTMDKELSTTPALPPGLAELNSVSRDEFFTQMERHPLFMRNLESTDSENDELEAIRALAYEGTPREVALNFKEQGNEAFREKRYRDALGFYSNGLSAKCGELDVEEPLLLNRAAVNLELGMSLGIINEKTIEMF
jgi:hypothetical protein